MSLPRSTPSSATSTRTFGRWSASTLSRTGRVFLYLLASVNYRANPKVATGCGERDKRLREPIRRSVFWLPCWALGRVDRGFAQTRSNTDGATSRQVMSTHSHILTRGRGVNISAHSLLFCSVACIVTSTQIECKLCAYKYTLRKTICMPSQMSIKRAR